MCTLTIENDNNSNESYKIQDNCCKESYIGDYAVTNCNYYGNYCLYKSFNLDTKLQMEYNKDSKAILVGQINGEKFEPIGELQIPDSDLKGVKHCLNMGWGKILFTCKISQNDEKAKINDRLRVTVWVKELKEETEKDKQK